MAAKHRIVPVWRELVADTVTPVAAFLQIVDGADRTGFLLESVEGGERWGRYSFVGRNPLATVTARGPTVTTDGRRSTSTRITGGRVSGTAGILAALEAILDAFESPDLPDLPPAPRRAGRLPRATTWSARSSTCRDTPPDDLGHPDAVLAVIGQLAAFDHWRQRVVLIDNVVDRPGVGRRASWTRAYGQALARLDQLAADCFRPLDQPPRLLPERAGPPADVRRTMSDALYEDAVRAAKEHVDGGRRLPGGAVPAVRPRRPRGRPVRRLPGAAPGQPEPLPLLPALPRGHRGRGLARAHGPAPRRDGHLAAHRRLPAPRAPPRRRTPGSRASWSRTRRRWPST